MIYSSTLKSPLGTMIALSDERSLYLLEFADCPGLEKEIEKVCSATKSKVIEGTSVPLQSIAQELKAYFAGELRCFTTPFQVLGTPFQQRTWAALQDIPYGETRSYAGLACAVEKPTAHRAVANANGANQLAILIPCHRVINTGGALGGYKGNLMRKKWLLDHEKHVVGI